MLRRLDDIGILVSEVVGLRLYPSVDFAIRFGPSTGRRPERR